MRATRNNMLVLVAVGALVAACGGSGSSESTVDVPDTVPSAVSTDATTTDATSTTPTSATSESTTPTTEPDDVIDSFDEVRPAVIQIIAQGSFRDPEVGDVVSAGSGSGFIISEDGLAVTNNHVVTGAATLEVYIGGDASQSYNATVLGVSECNDLALIDIVESEPLPYLEWSTDPPAVGTEVYAAGFPLGETEFTMTRGIVAKAEASGDTMSSSIDSVIEHDANIQHGNSGGPLVGTDGKVLGVNYRGRPWLETVQFFAISSDLAQVVVDQLADGDFESLGINGSAVLDEESGLSGIWVAGTAPGSPASTAGILPGDIVTSLNGLPMGTDGTMEDYCDVIRTAGDHPIKVEVLRFDTQEVLEGEINGDKPLEQTLSFADEVEDEAGPTGGTGTAYSGATTEVVDDTGVLSVSVPAEWPDIDTAPLEDGTAWISAAPNLSEFYDTYTTPGMVMMWSPPVDPAAIPATIGSFAPPEDACVTDGTLYDLTNDNWSGQYQLWIECGGVGALYMVLVSNSNAGNGAAVVVAQLVTDADFDALDIILPSMMIVG